MRPARTVPVVITEVAARIAEALAEQAPVEIVGDAGVRVTGATLRAHEVRPGDLFAALPGSRAHGADFADQALERGAAAVLTDTDGAARPALRAAGVPVLVHADPRGAIGPAAARVYGDPSTRLDVLGVTGTSGKTTTVYLLEAALAAAGARTGLIGTVETRLAGRRLPSAFTTPEAPDLQALLARMADEGATHVAMEVSSHALALGRVAGTRFAVGAFTNLSAEHLDFHADMEDYFAAKAKLFDGRSAAEVVCVDSPWGRRLVREHTVTVGAPDADWRAEDVVALPDGTQRFTVHGPDGLVLPAALRLPGAFNVTNALLALACGRAAGHDPEVLVRGLAEVRVPGRMQRVEAGQPFLAVVDYAHKPAAVAALLETLRAQTEGRVLTVLGCGGDRDRAKRPVMGRLAAQLSDHLWVTDDNPRTEDPAAIRAAVLEGAREVADAAVDEIGDRREAIGAAVAAARPGDVVVVAGKGHETGQQVGDEKLPFSDVEELERALRAGGPT
ncbi:UDP-N-acetylmuramoyl-L-alanyl-D-glutamate--2,6-diaminopimelate ligase [Actinomycetospora sp. DW7H6]|uniref:UDP-N-acetylmuramoyl-L-alanyl-D-glutamate--2,6-diaminopimelate ligase n=1 Tax=Actinomycetospora lemnae TaxID=3019891 RepID=A0ABT5T3N2_9PSEU|nr:UDP-N-acetylmuramoyl-L-alanyl-D-glutamate--2,6-diaminopimelate ligase [Actinomycetospora sp. DW7H6]MDD7968822.1 UDP-N-acetylmuramoyl-L-alanyl-D-glutamate--2,6-diaminopimelate ligase [Actinomycetospora sp. DW7H6]